jgi:protein-S-isoprenylcysteine O-methyltransferase Ste14
MIAMLLYFLVTPGLLFLAAGTLRWWQGWVYAVLMFTGMIAGRLMVLRVHPGLLVERATAGSQANVKAWDRRLVPWIGQIGPLLVIITAGLDRRFGWSPPLPLWLQLAGLGLLLGGYALANWAFYTNQFFSAYVRIQHERGHYVIDQGPYRWVRHPGYAGGILAWLAAPIFLGTMWALIPSLLVSTLAVARTALEDRTLQVELDGYQEYARRTRFRLLPGVW